MFKLDLSNFNTSNVVNFDSMFSATGYNSEVFTLDVSSFDTSNATNMSSMFSATGYNSENFTLDVSNFDTSNVTSMTRIFESCNVETLDLSTWDTSKVKIDSNAFARPFYDFEGKYLILGDKCKFENVNYFSNMFRDCKNLISLDLSNWNIPNATTMDSMFRYCTSLTSLDVSNFNTSNVTGMSYMFSDCYSLTNIDLSSFDTSNVTKMDNMFYNCHILQRIDGFIDWTKISSYPSNFIYTTSSYGNPLRYMVIKNIGKTGTTFNFNNTSLQNWGDETDTTTYPLSVGARQSLVDSLLTYSFDRVANGLSTCTIQLHPNVKARLTADEITAIQNKGYTIS
jgi:surface protein